MTVHPEKLREAILFFANHPAVRGLGLTKLYKLLYYADVRRLRETGDVSVTGSEYIRYEHGPVPSRGDRELKKLRKQGAASTATEDNHGYQMTAVHARRAADTSVFSPAELACLDAVASELGGSTARELSERSHVEPAWAYARSLDKLDVTLMLYGAAEDPDGL
jgi:uncharacterized phage-associated protein